MTQTQPKQIKINFKNSLAWYYPAVIFIVALVGLVSTIYTYKTVDQSIKTTLLQRVGTIANSLDQAEIQNLFATKDDLNNPAYINLKTKLKNIRAVNSDARFIYAMGMKSGEVFFYADSEPNNSPDMSPPGQIYTEATQSLKQVFTNKQPTMLEIYSDRWGTWLTGLYPILNSKKEVLAVIAMDINANEYNRSLIIYSSFPAGLTLFLLLLITTYFLIKQQESKRMALWAELLSVASHEVRSPLNGMLWATEGLLDKAAIKLTKEQAKTLLLMKNSCNSMLDTVNYFLDIYSLERKKQDFIQERLDLSTLINEAVSSFELSSQKKEVEIEFLSLPKSYILGDKDKLKRMFNNLISNALKYSASGSKIIIKVSEQENLYLISIKDSGIGIPAKDQQRVFQGFYRAKNAVETEQQGTGLGLYYVKQVVQMHNGKITFSSAENAGTIFYIELPKIS
jgi:signal transduction histidine kinase